MNSSDSKPTLGVVIPTLNACAGLTATLRALEDGRDHFDLDVVVVDGGSAGDTVAVARAQGVRVVETEKGRGVQLAAGAKAVAGEGLLFLHADTVLAPGWGLALRGFIAQPDANICAVYFRFELDDDHAGARRIERWVAWRCRKYALPYGDQGLALPRDLYDTLGGFAPMALMEDVNFVSRIKHHCGRESLVGLDVAARTSAVRYKRGGYWLRPVRNLLCLALYFTGIPLRTIAKIYR
ncbi:MAG: TIGR04283 family arsenosugar biosynthesis glycosyltransferase [Alphaproteobacteria bacterium]|jgi:rSAM/selenodomain-associated transferase 2|nr:TIGR04283 family arsenosugar biosynthesis glycosyltransferase [Alphaproteobacteria bacterium]